MASRGKKKTTMAKLSRESRLRERKQEKASRKEARRLDPAIVHDAAAADEFGGMRNLPSPASTGEPKPE